MARLGLVRRVLHGSDFSDARLQSIVSEKHRSSQPAFFFHLHRKRNLKVKYAEFVSILSGTSAFFFYFYIYFFCLLPWKPVVSLTMSAYSTGRSALSKREK